MSKFPRISTGKGDHGVTDLWSGERVSKTDPRIKAVGAIDLALSALGMAVAELNSEVDAQTRDDLNQLWRRCPSMMGEISCSEEKKEKFRSGRDPISASDVDWINRVSEKVRLELESKGKTFDSWKQYGLGGRASAALYFARGLFRDAEVKLCEVVEKGFTIRKELLVFTNRISDYLFLLAVSKEK